MIAKSDLEYYKCIVKMAKMDLNNYKVQNYFIDNVIEPEHKCFCGQIISYCIL